MIAIAGAKGGCGTTVTTLGLASAFARAGTPTLAVDADRQLPDLHVVAGVDRDPTITDAEPGSDVATLAQPLPDSPDVGVLPAPRPSDRIDLRKTLRRLSHEAGQVLVDCPSGAGPDTVDPVAAADLTIVVTSNTSRGVAAAETTIEMSRRLDVPVAGIVITRSDAVPDGIAALDAPVLGRVPEIETGTPLEADPARNAYDRAVSALTDETGSPLEGHRSHRDDVPDGDPLGTGIEIVDRELGGLPAGSTVVLTADVDSQSEVLLYELTGSRGTLYLSTERSAETVRSDIEGSTVDAGCPTVRHVDGAAAPGEVRELLGELPDRANVVVDTMNEFERLDRDEYLEFQNALVERVRSMGGLTLLHCVRGPSVPENRVATEHFADFVLDLRTTTDEGTVSHVLSIPKARRANAPTETLEFDLSHPLSRGRTRDSDRS